MGANGKAIVTQGCRSAPQIFRRMIAKTLIHTTLQRSGEKIRARRRRPMAAFGNAHFKILHQPPRPRNANSRTWEGEDGALGSGWRLNKLDSRDAGHSSGLPNAGKVDLSLRRQTPPKP